MSFISKFLGVKVDQTVNAAYETLAGFDPNGMTEAQIRQMDEQLTQLSLTVANARSIAEKELKEAVQAKSVQDERFKVADILQRKMENETDPAKKGALEKDLNSVLSEIERFVPELEREQREAREAEEQLHFLEKSQADAAEKLKTVRRLLSDSVRAMERAAINKENAAREEQAAKQAAGIAQATGTIDTALKAIQARTERDNTAAAASRDKARLLGPAQVHESDNIREALAEAQGKTAESHLSPTERLAALKAARDQAAA